MGYRDDHEGLRSRVADLEAELAEADRTIGRLQGALPSGQRPPPVTAPLRLRREVDGELSEEGLRTLTRLLDVRMPGQVPIDRSERKLRQQSPSWVFVVESNGRGGTRLALSEPATGGRGLLLAAVSLSMTTIASAITVLTAGPVAATLGAFALAVALLGMPLAFWWARRQRQLFAGVFEAAVMLAEEHTVSERLDSGRGMALRIASDDVDAEEEAQAAEEADVDPRNERA